MKLEDICFVYTNSSAQGRFGTHAFDLVYPPLGLAYLASVLKAAGYSVQILDASALQLTTEETLERLNGRFRIVGFYCHTQNYPLIAEMAASLRASERPPHILLGGPHATALPRESLRDAPAIDALVYGEGEQTIGEVVQRLLAGESLGGVAGTWYRDGDAIVENPPRAQVEDLDSLPMPAWHLLPMARYQSFIESDGRKALQIIGSRGCFSDCNYCFSTKMWGPRARWHSAERILAEMEHLRQHYGVRFFQFFDDNFTLDAERLRQLMPAFRARGLSNRWVCSTRIDLLDEERVALLAQGGVHHVAVGMETVNDRLLEVINKKVTKAQTETTLALCRRYGIRVLGMFILGLPSETTEETLETLEFACRSDLYLAVFSHLTVYPGTNFWDRFADSPHLERDFSRYSLAKNFTYVEPSRSLEELNHLIQRAYRSFYLRPRVLLTLTWMMLRNPSKIWAVVRGFVAVIWSLLRPQRAAAR